MSANAMAVSASEVEAFTHPAGRATHALRNALTVLRALNCEPHEQPPAAVECNAVVFELAQLIGPVLKDVAALHQYIEQQERNIATMTEESNQTNRELTAANERNTALTIELEDVKTRLAQSSVTTEQLYVDTSMELQRASERFNRIRGLREQLDPSLVGKPYSVTQHNAPRNAAAEA